MRLIDVEVAEKNWWQELRTNYADDYGKGFQAGLLAVIRQPTIEAEPVKHGQWEHLGGDEWYCTNCGEVISTEGSWDKPIYKHCHECGAKMDGERVALEEVVDIDAQTQRNNAAMRRVIDFVMDGGNDHD